MPFVPSDAQKYTKKADTDERREKWASVANSVLEQCLADGGDPKECDAKAIRIANSQIREGANLSKEEAKALQELWDDPEVLSLYVPFNAASFDDVEAAQQAKEMADKTKAEVYLFERLLENIFFLAEIDDKQAAIRRLFNELEERLFPAPIEESEVIKEQLQESFDSVEVLSEGAVLEEGAGPLSIKVVPILPGWGNKKDNRYYPVEVLRRDADKFIGAKMYETNHRKDEKNTRTWVSTITGILGFSDDGAPLAEAVVHSPDFAQRLRNLKEANLLNKMECSIDGWGATVPYKEGERSGKKVTSILEIGDVDWVTKAGAGGHADALLEGDEEMTKEEDRVEDEVIETEEEPTEEQPVVEFLSEAEVTEALEGMNVPRAEIRERLLEKQYHDADEIKAALDKEIAYVKKITESGKPKDLGEKEKPKPKKSDAERLAEAEAKKTALAKKWFHITEVEEQA